MEGELQKDRKQEHAVVRTAWLEAHWPRDKGDLINIAECSDGGHRGGGNVEKTWELVSC